MGIEDRHRFIEGGFLQIAVAVARGELGHERAIALFMAEYQSTFGAGVRALAETDPTLARALILRIMRDLESCADRYHGHTKKQERGRRAHEHPLRGKSTQVIEREMVIMDALIIRTVMSLKALHLEASKNEPLLSKAALTAHLQRLVGMAIVRCPRKGHYESCEATVAYLASLNEERAARPSQ